MTTVQLPDSQRFDTKFVIRISKHNADFSLAQGFQKHLYNSSRQNDILYRRRIKKVK